MTIKSTRPAHGDPQYPQSKTMRAAKAAQDKADDEEYEKGALRPGWLAPMSDEEWGADWK